MSDADLWRDADAAWQPYRPTAGDPWDRARAAHLHRRAGFGVSEARLRRDLADGYEASLRRVLEGEGVGPDGRPVAEFEEIAGAMEESARRDPVVQRIQCAWLYRMHYSPRPLEERLTLAWHGHYACGADKARSAADLLALNVTQRTLGRGRLSKLHLAVLRSPAMLAWLDAVGSAKGRPNENLGREFLELFALGEGNYAERDVREAARALTGWSDVPTEGGTKTGFVAALHDAGPKTVLGETGPWGDEDLVRIVCRQQAAARHVARLLIRTFVADTEEVPAALVEGLARAMRVDGDVDVGRGVETVLRSQLFHSPAYRGKRVKGPPEFVVGALRTCEALTPPPELPDLVERLARMGQRLFYPPSVAGWKAGLAWLRGPTVIARADFAAFFARPDGPLAAGHLLGAAQRAGWQTPAQWAEGFGGLLCGVTPSAARLAEAVESAKQGHDAAEACGRVVQCLLSSAEGQLA